jgi:hypothetical protein
VKRCLQLLVLCLTLATALLAQGERVVLTQDDLLRMADTGLPASLILKVIETADEVPVLQPSDITDLAQKGVPYEALEAVVGRRARPNSSTTVTATESIVPVKGRIDVTATLEQRKGLMGAMRRDSDAGFAVYWGAAALDADGKPLPVESCTKQPACWCVSATGERTCAAPAEPEWAARFSCFEATEMQPRQAATILSIDAPTGMAELRVYPFYMVQDKAGSMQLTSWDGPRGAAYLGVEPSSSSDYAAEAGLTLSLGRNARTNLELPVRRFDAGGGRPGTAGRISIRDLTLSTTPLPQSCQQ